MYKQTQFDKKTCKAQMIAVNLLNFKVMPSVYVLKKRVYENYKQDLKIYLVLLWNYKILFKIKMNTKSKMLRIIGKMVTEVCNDTQMWIINE